MITEKGIPILSDDHLFDQIISIIINSTINWNDHQIKIDQNVTSSNSHYSKMVLCEGKEEFSALKISLNFLSLHLNDQLISLKLKNEFLKAISNLNLKSSLFWPPSLLLVCFSLLFVYFVILILLFNFLIYFFSKLSLSFIFLFCYFIYLLLFFLFFLFILFIYLIIYLLITH